jgi:hypothetical protein
MGKPGRSNVLSPEREQTRGSETSQYPEEETSNEIPVVAASEPGLAQTDPTLCGRGCRTPSRDPKLIAEWSGKANQRR